MKVRIKKLHADAKMPTYATDGSACFDLYSTGKMIVSGVAPDATGTGLAFEVPVGHVMLIFSRSGHGYKDSVRLSNCVGVIDSDYRGEVSVKLHRDMVGVSSYSAGERVAQAMILPIEQAQFEFADELSRTDRGAGGFGSTGK